MYIINLYFCYHCLQNDLVVTFLVKHLSIFLQECLQRVFDSLATSVISISSNSSLVRPIMNYLIHIVTAYKIQYCANVHTAYEFLCAGQYLFSNCLVIFQQIQLYFSFIYCFKTISFLSVFIFSPKMYFRLLWEDYHSSVPFGLSVLKIPF